MKGGNNYYLKFANTLLNFHHYENFSRVFMLYYKAGKKIELILMSHAEVLLFSPPEAELPHISKQPHFR